MKKNSIKSARTASRIDEPTMIYANVAGVELQFETAPSLFSPTKLDRGSLAMLSCISFEPTDKVLDLACGYGLVGIYAAKVIGPGRVWMADNDPMLSSTLLRISRLMA